MKKTCYIKNLDCANCALKIENEFLKLKGVEHATVDYAKEMVFIQSKNHYSNEMLEKIAQSIEHKVEIHDDYHLEDDSQKKVPKELITNILGVMILLFNIISIHFKFINHNYIVLLLYIVSYVMIGGKVLYKAIKNLLHKQFLDEHFLMSIATIGAFIIGEYIEGVAVMLFYRVGEYLQDLAVNSSKKSIKALLDINPVIAHLLDENEIKNVKPEDLKIDQHIKVYPGEKIPVDGILVEGSSTVDQSKLTGESIPVDVAINSNLISGSINLSGVITMKVSETYENSTVYKIIQFAKDNAHKKAKTEKFITKFAKYYTPIVVGLAILLAFVVPFFHVLLNSNETYLSLLNIYLKRALIFLVISCPCALVLSIPLSFFSGIGASSKQGVLIKSGSDIESFANLKYIVFDKTGTLTKGQFEVVSIQSSQKEKCLEYAAHAERFSNHPIAQSIVQTYQKKIDEKCVTEVNEIFGQGIICKYKNLELLVGNERLMDHHQIKYEKDLYAQTIVYVAYHHEFIGSILISDTLKETTKKTIDHLKHMHIEVLSVTGDQEHTTHHMLSDLNIKYYANCLPQDKVDIVDSLIKKGKTAFIGDGVNDAPVLMISDLGVAMGGLGSDAAIEASDAVIMNDEPIKVVETIHLSKKTMRIVKQNIVLAIGVKLVVLILGALGFASMWYAIFADVGVSLLAVFNTLRIFNSKHKMKKAF